MKYRPHEFTEIAGVSVKTLQRWDNEGKLKANRTKGNHRFYTDEHVALVRGLTKTTKINVIYCRVSSYPQKPELENQLSAMRNFCTANGVEIGEEIIEIGGGMNFKRKKFQKLIAMILSSKVNTIYLAHKDRLVRFGFDLIEYICELNQSKIVVANNENLSPQQEMVEDLMAIIHCFSCRLYGLRDYSKKIKKTLDKTLTKN